MSLFGRGAKRVCDAGGMAQKFEPILTILAQAGIEETSAESRI